jgi:hypothetical protein
MLGLSILAVLAISATGLDAAVTRAVKPSINNTVESGMMTECKTCPYSLCTNKAYYGYLAEETVTLTCYTFGDVIGGDDGNK